MRPLTNYVGRNLDRSGRRSDHLAFAGRDWTCGRSGKLPPQVSSLESFSPVALDRAGVALEEGGSPGPRNPTSKRELMLDAIYIGLAVTAFAAFVLYALGCGKL